MGVNDFKIVPHLWFDKEAREAAAFYASVFPKSRVVDVSVLPDTPSGDCDVVSFEVWGQPFQALSAGPLFKPNPSISFVVNFDPLFFDGKDEARAKLDEIWKELSDGGTALMPLGEYPFSPHYGWVQDRYGYSWQLMLTDPEGDPRPPIVPMLMFANDVFGKGEEAIDYYVSIFENARKGNVTLYGPGQAPNEEGTLMFGDFAIGDTWIAVIDAAGTHDFKFNEALSLMVYCESQEAIDYYWEKLSAVPEAEACGWLKDKYGVSWQVVPAVFDELLRSGTKEQIKAMMSACEPMKKLDIAALKAAWMEK